jgi:hypothetical protein
MQIVHDVYHYHDDEQILELGKKISNTTHLKVSLHFLTTEFLHSQQDMMHDFIASFVEKATQTHYDYSELGNIFQWEIQQLNTKLKAFAEKIDKVDYFHIKWCLQLVVDGVLMTSMIGDTSVMIFRNNKLYYSLHNTLDKQEKIDVFADFIEWDLELHDHIVYIGTKVSDVLDDTDVATLEEALANSSTDFVLEAKTLLESRIEKARFSFIVVYILRGAIETPVAANRKKWKLLGMAGGLHKRLGKAKLPTSFASINKYYVIAIFGWLFVLFLLYQVFNNLLQSTQNDIILTEDGTLVDVTIDDIKKEIQLFQSLDPISDEKSQTYNSIMQKLDALEERGRRLEDVTQLRKIVQQDYNRGFNIIYVTDLSQFNDPTSDYTSNIFTFNNAELNALGDIQTLDYTRELMIGGNNAALMWALNNSVRGTLIDYGVDNAVKGCTLNLLKDGLYCFSDTAIFAVNREGVQTVTTTDEAWFPSDIDEILTYGQANLYLFHENFAQGSTGATFVTRYRNTAGSQTQFQEGQDNSVLYASLDGNQDFSQGFSDYAIDGSFLARSSADGEIYQFRREGVSTLLSARAIPMRGGDRVGNQLSENVKIIASVGSRYIYLFDRTNKTFSVYTSNPSKQGDAFIRDFTLQYLFSFTFDLAETQVIDIDVPESTQGRPELYILTQKGVNRVKLYEFIDSLASGTLKQL